MRSKASYKGHPIHPALIPFPFAFLYGASGSTDFNAIAEALGPGGVVGHGGRLVGLAGGGFVAGRPGLGIDRDVAGGRDGRRRPSLRAAAGERGSALCPWAWQSWAFGQRGRGCEIPLWCDRSPPAFQIPAPAARSTLCSSPPVTTRPESPANCATACSARPASCAPPPPSLMPDVFVLLSEEAVTAWGGY